MVYGASFENWWAKVRMGSNPIPSAQIFHKKKRRIGFIRRQPEKELLWNFLVFE